MLAPLEFFTLDAFIHKDLWQKGDFVWSALTKLKSYLEKIDSHKIEIEIPSGIFLQNPEKISIGKGTVIEPGVMIKGPCIIGKNCHISHGAYLREMVILGDFCHIGHAAELKGSILLNGAKATHFVYVGDSILGNEVNLGAGVKCANLRLDRKSIYVKAQKEKIDTGLKKFGAIVGDFSQVGCNTVLNPGTLLAKNSLCPPMGKV